MTIPTFLTLSRLFLLPAFVIAFYLPWHFAKLAAVCIFIIGAVTDYLDGYLARSLQQATEFGAFLDPVVDKLIVATALLLIVEEVHVIYVTIPAAVIVAREILVSALREWMAEIGKRANVAVTLIGKIKTTIQMLAVISLLLLSWHEAFKIAGIILLYIAVFLTLISMVMYIKAAWPNLTFSKDKG